MPKITSVAFCLLLATLSSLSHSDLFCQEAPCDIQITYENGGELTANQAIITFGEGASIQLGESGSYNLGLSGYIYDSDIIDLDAQTDIPAGTKVYLGTGAKLVFSNEGYLHLGNGGNIENLDESETQFNGVSNIENLTDSTLLFAPTSNGQADYTFIASNSIVLDSTQSSHFKVQSDEVTIQSYDLNIAIPDILEAKTLNFLVYNGEIQLETQIPFNGDASSMSLADLTLTSGPTISISDGICTIGEAPCSVHLSDNDSATLSDSIIIGYYDYISAGTANLTVGDEQNPLLNGYDCDENDSECNGGLFTVTEEDCNTQDQLMDYSEATEAYVTEFSEVTIAYNEATLRLLAITEEVENTDTPTEEQLMELAEAKEAYKEAEEALSDFSERYNNEILISEDEQILRILCSELELAQKDKDESEGGGSSFWLLTITLLLSVRRSHACTLLRRVNVI